MAIFAHETSSITAVGECEAGSGGSLLNEVDPDACAYGSSCRSTIVVLTALSCHSVERPLVEALPIGTATLPSARRMARVVTLQRLAL